MFEPSGPLVHTGFCSMKQLGVFLLPDAVPHRVTPSIKSAVTPVPIYLPGWGLGRNIRRVKGFAQEHNTMAPA